MKLVLEARPDGTAALCVVAPLADLPAATRVAAALESLFGAPEAAVGPQATVEPTHA